MRYRWSRAGGLACRETQAAETQGAGPGGWSKGGRGAPAQTQKTRQSRRGEGAQGEQEEEEEILSSGVMNKYWNPLGNPNHL